MAQIMSMVMAVFHSGPHASSCYWTVYHSFPAMAVLLRAAASDGCHSDFLVRLTAA